jgi:hypothetical protein
MGSYTQATASHAHATAPHVHATAPHVHSTAPHVLDTKPLDPTKPLPNITHYPVPHGTIMFQFGKFYPHSAKDCTNNPKSIYTNGGVTTCAPGYTPGYDSATHTKCVCDPPTDIKQCMNASGGKKCAHNTYTSFLKGNSVSQNRCMCTSCTVPPTGGCEPRVQNNQKIKRKWDATKCKCVDDKGLLGDFSETEIGIGIVVILVVAGAAAYYFFGNSQKSDESKTEGIRGAGSVVRESGPTFY